MIVRFEIGEEQARERLDTALTSLLAANRSVSRAQVLSWIEQELVQVNAAICAKGSYRLKTGDAIEVKIPEPRTLLLEPQDDVPFQVVFEDKDIIVIDKPAGVAVHPGAGNYKNTLVNGLLHRLGPELQQIGDAIRPGIVHRLDKDTSGLLVVAKSELAFRSLRDQLKPPRTMERKYLCLAERIPKKGAGSTLSAEGMAGTIDLPLGRHPSDRKKMAVRQSGGKSARTHWKVREVFSRAVLLEAELETGRTHQIRVHLAACGAPLLGDPVYSKTPVGLSPRLLSAVKKFKRQALHAAKLSFLHPLSNSPVTFESPLPEDFRSLLEAMRD